MDPCSSNSCCSRVIWVHAKKKKNPLEILPMIGFLTVPYDPILSMFGHSNLIIWVLPLFLYIIMFLFSKYYIDKSFNTNLFRLLSPCCNYEWHDLGKGGSESHPHFKYSSFSKEWRSHFFIKRRCKSPYIYSSYFLFFIIILFFPSFWPTNMLNSPHRQKNDR